MPELRKEPIVGRWVIVTTERGRRPVDFHDEVAAAPAAGVCPLCPGSEDKTPPEILAYRADGSARNGPGWSLRVVPSKFPVLRVEGELSREGEGMYDRMSGIGAHEVIIESPDHGATMASLPVEHVAQILGAFRERMLDLKRDGRLRYALVFKNHGEAAGALLPHSHSQLIALPIVPKAVREEIDGAQAHFEAKERCIFCDIIRQEREKKVRIIEESSLHVALAPFASRAPFETWILPKRHSWAFEEADRSLHADLAGVLSIVLRKLDRALRRPPYHLMLHTAPLSPKPRDGSPEAYHWHIEILPRLTRIAGFEWGSGFYINPTPPEEAAEYLREIALE